MLNQPLRWLAAVTIAAVAILLAAGCSSSSNNASHPSTSASAHPMSANALACHKLSVTLAQAPSTLGKLAMHPANAGPAVTAFTTKLKKNAASASGPVLRAVDEFTIAVQHAVASLRTSKPDISAMTTQLTKAADTISTACKSSG
jgi:hypothetical protein